jgi:hypothetical protein
MIITLFKPPDIYGLHPLKNQLITRKSSLVSAGHVATRSIAAGHFAVLSGRALAWRAGYVGGYRLHEHMANDVLRYAELLFECAGSRRLKLYPRQDVITIFVPVDGVGQAALAPGLLLGNFTANVGDDSIHALGGGGELLIAHGGPDYVHQFVVAHLLSHLLSMGLPRRLDSGGV